MAFDELNKLQDSEDKKHPLGAEPEWSFLETRIANLINALQRYIPVLPNNKDIMCTWADELSRRLKEYKEVQS